MSAEDTGGTPQLTPVAPSVGGWDIGRAAAARRVAVRTGSALLVLGLCAAVVLVGGRVPVPEAGAASAQVVEVPAAAQQLVCPGPLRLPTEPDPGGDVSYDPQFDPAPAASETTVRVAAVGDGRGRLSPVGDPEDALAELAPVDDAETAESADPAGGSVLRVDPGESGPPLVAGVVGVVTADGDLRGTVAAPCRPPAAELWLVGGSTVLGSSARLVLQNPGRTPATVALRLWGPAGPVEVAGAPEFLVPPRSERVVLLEGVAAEQRRLVVHLVATGGLVTAYLQDSLLRGLVPAGVDHVSPGEAPSVRQVVAGVDLPETEVDGADAPVLRLLAPDEPTTARITLLGPDGPLDVGGSEVRLDAGTVLDVPLAGVPAGSWTAVVDADGPVVAGVMLTRGAGVGTVEDGAERRPLERAWVPSVPTGLSAVVALPAGMPARLVVGALPEGRVPATARVELVGADGSLGGEDVEVGSGSTVVVTVDDLAESVGVDPEEVTGAVVRTDDDRVAWATVHATPARRGALVSVVVPVAPEALRSVVGVTVR